jgi:hypothetical protein
MVKFYHITSLDPWDQLSVDLGDTYKEINNILANWNGWQHTFTGCYGCNISIPIRLNLFNICVTYQEREQIK